jgi:hypothetical protein
LGFEAEVFGPRTVLVRSVPELLSQADPKPLLEAGIAALLSGQQPVEVLARMAACARTTEPWGQPEAKALLQQADALGINAPALFARLSVDELRQRFGRD